MPEALLLLFYDGIDGRQLGQCGQWRQVLQGNQLDSMAIKGKIIGPVMGQGEKEMTVLLFDADSIRNNDILRKRPAYITKTDDNGEFEFKYLRNAAFKVFGLKDGDQSNTYSIETELVALSEDSVIRFSDDSTQLATTRLFSFLPDDTDPQLRNYVWITPNTIAVKFSEDLRLDSLNLVLTDTLYQDSIQVESYSFQKGSDPEVWIHMERPKSEFSLLHFTNVQDSLFNSLDTVLLVKARGDREITNPLINKPELNLEKQAWEFFTYKLFRDADSSLFSLTDTSRTDSLVKQFPYSFERNGFSMQIKPTTKLDGEAPYLLRIKGAFFSELDSTVGDTTYLYPIKWFNTEDYGTLSGGVAYDSSYSGPIVLHLIDDKKKAIRTVFDTTFAFTLIPAGSYTFKIIMDADSNGVWTPGSLYPPRMPEKIYIDNSPVTIRANWDFEDHKIQIGAQAATPVKEEGEGENSEGEELPQGIPNTRPPNRRP